MNRECIVFGAGSIGKSVAAYCFRTAGMNVLFADIDRQSIDDINRRAGYRIYSSGGRVDLVDGIHAVMVQDTAVLTDRIGNADYLSTSVGESGLRPVLDKIAAGISNRTKQEPVKIILCENIPHSYDFAFTYLKERADPGRFIIIEASVERMTKPCIGSAGERDVIAEPFIPLILNRLRYGQDEVLSFNKDLFFETDQFESYYYRKIHTNNLGHAILGYLGHLKGYRYLSQSIEDPYIHKVLDECLFISGEMLQAKFGFTKEAMSGHLSSLMDRYSDSVLNDEVARVVKCPIRKLSKDERIIGTALKIMECSMDPGVFADVIAAALSYFDAGDGESVRLKEMMATAGIDSVLKNVCSLDENSRLFLQIKNRYKIFNGG